MVAAFVNSSHMVYSVLCVENQTVFLKNLYFGPLSHCNKKYIYVNEIRVKCYTPYPFYYCIGARLQVLNYILVATIIAMVNVKIY